MSSEPESRDDTSSASSGRAASQEQTTAARVWAQFQNVIFERLDAVEKAANALRGATLTPEVRKKAALEAHRLAGSLGMFGLTEGTRVAREIERLLADAAVLAPETPHQLTELTAALRHELEKGPA